MTACWPSWTSWSGTAADGTPPLRDRPDAYAATQHLAGLTERPLGWSDSEWDNLAGHLGLPLRPKPETSGDEDDIPPGPPVDRIEVAAGKLHVDRSVLDEIKQLLDDKGQIVLYGAPGTGKTYLAVELATLVTGAPLCLGSAMGAG